MKVEHALTSQLASRVPEGGRTVYSTDTVRDFPETKIKQSVSNTINRRLDCPLRAAINLVLESEGFAASHPSWLTMYE